MSTTFVSAIFVEFLLWLHGPARRRDERGLSQSTENAILLAGAVAVAGIVIAVVTNYVSAHLPR